ncbi:hypothetical protein B0E46_05760 [Rhodanobacter sp. B04]|uniref:pilus assembly protein n=1 Tax=Rhodanobacter sp. B04 TaxID=1945860 RepID=UPI00098483EA|nr:PilC/PilY family type IV pilus protein [Rhodanobacter sp. B04]OOG64897.1 hypothetical protein B0E46_05760 [Rhodanobacter sp. B04]
MSIRRLIFKRLPNAGAGMLLTLTAGLSVPVPVPTTLTVVTAAVAASAFLSEPASAATAAATGSVELSPAPPNLTQAVPPNIVLTFDDSGSMSSTRVNDAPPFTTDLAGNVTNSAYDWSGGPWRCANVIDSDHPSATDATLRALVMNGVYYNPNVTYTPPTYPNGNTFAAADATLAAVLVDGIAANRKLSPATTVAAAYNNNPELDQPAAGSQTNIMGQVPITYATSSTVTYYATFGTTCPSSSGNSVVSACSSNNSSAGSSSAGYYFYTKGATTTTGSGVSTVYSGANLLARNTSSSGYTKTVVVTGSAAAKYSTWTVTVTTTSTTPTYGTPDNRWKCGTGQAGGSDTADFWSGASPMDGQAHTLSDGTAVTYPNGGPYYYRLKTGVTVNLNANNQPSTATDLATLYTPGNWEAVPVPTTQYQNFANWYAYYRTRNQMARSALSRVFGSLGANITNGTTTTGYGNSIRVAWQNLNTSAYNLPSSSIISSLIDTSACTSALSNAASPSTIQQSGAVTTAPACYRSAFYNWLFQVPASGGTPTRSTVAAAGAFFQRGKNNTAATGNLKDPYWQPATYAADGTTVVNSAAELYCRQNYHMLVTDGLWNGNGDGPKTSTLTAAALAPTTGTLTLPDGTVMPATGTAGISSIYAPVHDSGDSGYASLSDIAFYYWSQDLRPDLYIPLSQQYVTPYIADTTTGVVTSTTNSGSSVAAANVNSEIYFNPNNDPATWPHMSEYLVGLGVNGALNYSTDVDCTGGTSDTSDACNLRKGLKNSSGSIGWPTPNGNGSGIPANVDDTWHAALAGRGQFFSAGNPADLVSKLSAILANIAARNVPAATSAISATVLTGSTLGFNTGYSSADWSGVLQAFIVNLDGSIGALAWDAGTQLNAATPANRVILSSKFTSAGAFNGGVEFKTYTNLDSPGQTLIMTPASTGANDTGQARVDWLRGVKTSETNGTMRQRTKLLGAIIRSQAVYVAYPASGYSNTWPALADGTAAPETTATTSPVAGTADVSYEQFSSDQSARKPVVYVGANDGMLHAFDASQNADGSDTATSGNELWAYVPRSVYSNLGNMTLLNGFTFTPTVDATPVTRDVFFDAATTSPATTSIGWHTILVGGLGQGGRGIYALDVTDPNPADTAGVNASNVGSKVLWEFNAGMAAVASASNGSGGTNPGGNPADLGYTYGQPNIGRLANGKWVVLVPGGYFPDCTKGTGDQPANCSSNNTVPSSGSPAVNFSSLFVLDAQTGALINEIKTPTNISGVSSYGLSSPVLGDYNNDQIDDVAFAGDLAGNLWRYDLTNPDPSKWSVSLAYKPATQGAQPITVMPRLFPDPATNRFIVVFGTGKYLGASDNTASGLTQSVYGIRDTLTTVSGTTNLVQQTLNEVAGTGANAGNTIVGITSNAVPVSYNGWYFNLVANGERVVVTPGALFDTNRAVITTLIPNNSNGCASNNTGALLIVDATTGGAGDGVPVGPSSWTSGGVTFKAVGGLVNNPPTGGTVPVATSIGGGQLLFPGTTLTGGGTLTGDDSIWRRRSWRELNNDQ